MAFAGDAEQTLAIATKVDATPDKVARADAVVAIAMLEPDHWAEGARRVQAGKHPVAQVIHLLLETGGDASAMPLYEKLHHRDLYFSFNTRAEVLGGQLTLAAERSRVCTDRPRIGDITSWDMIALVDRPFCLYWRARAFEGLGKKQEASAAYARLASMLKEAEPGLPLKRLAEEGLRRTTAAVPEVMNHAQ
jgi:hypothetical protein